MCALSGVLCLWLWWNGWKKEAAAALGMTAAGLLAVVVPCSAWLVFHGVWKEAMNEYLLCSVRYGTVAQEATWWAKLLRPAPVRCLSDILMWAAVIWALAIAGWRQLKTQKALLFTALLYIFFKVEMFSVYNYYYNSILSPMMIWVTIFFVAQAERRFSLRLPRMAVGTLAIVCLTGAGMAAGLTGPSGKETLSGTAGIFIPPPSGNGWPHFPEPPSCTWAGWTGASALPGTGSPAEDIGFSRISRRKKWSGSNIITLSRACRISSTPVHGMMILFCGSTAISL